MIKRDILSNYKEAVLFKACFAFMRITFNWGKSQNIARGNSHSFE